MAILLNLVKSSLAASYALPSILQDWQYYGLGSIISVELNRMTDDLHGFTYLMFALSQPMLSIPSDFNPCRPT